MSILILQFFLIFFHHPFGFDIRWKKLHFAWNQKSRWFITMRAQARQFHRKHTHTFSKVTVNLSNLWQTNRWFYKQIISLHRTKTDLYNAKRWQMRWRDIREDTQTNIKNPTHRQMVLFIIIYSRTRSVLFESERRKKTFYANIYMQFWMVE